MEGTGELLNRQCRYLWIDASARQVRTGVLQAGHWLAFITADNEAPALENLPHLLRLVLRQANLRLDEVDGFIHCEGPGSVLGIRIASASIEAWRSLPGFSAKPVFVYRGLELAGWILKHSGDLAKTKLMIASESRLKRVNVFHVHDKVLQEVCESAMANFTGQCLHMPQRPNPPAVLADLPKFQPQATELAWALHESGLVRKSNQATVYTANTPVYRKWPGNRHRV